MAWKLKKSKVDDTPPPTENSSGVIISHGHQGAATVQPEDTDFFASTLDDIDQTISDLHGVRSDGMPNFEAAEEPAYQRPVDIPVVQSAFVSAPADDHISFETVTQPGADESDDVSPNRVPMNFDDVEFNLDGEPETVEFGHSPSHIDDELSSETHSFESDLPIGGQEIEAEEPAHAPGMNGFSSPIVAEPIDEVSAVSHADIEDMNKTVAFGAPAPEVAAESISEPITEPIAEAMPEPISMASAPPQPNRMPLSEVMAAQKESDDEETAEPAETGPVPPLAPTVPLIYSKIAPSKLIVRIGPFAAEYDLGIAPDEMLIGRPDYNTGTTPAIAVELDDAISRSHARIIRVDGTYRVEDLGSKNGTLINGQPLMANVSMPFNIGDIVRVGERTELTLS